MWNRNPWITSKRSYILSPVICDCVSLTFRQVLPLWALCGVGSESQRFSVLTSLFKSQQHKEIEPKNKTKVQRNQTEAQNTRLRMWAHCLVTWELLFHIIFLLMAFEGSGTEEKHRRLRQIVQCVKTLVRNWVGCWFKSYDAEFRSIFTRRRGGKLSEKAEAQQIKWFRVIDLWSAGCCGFKSDVPQSVLESRRWSDENENVKRTCCSVMGTGVGLSCWYVPVN